MFLNAKAIGADTHDGTITAVQVQVAVDEAANRLVAVAALVFVPFTLWRGLPKRFGRWHTVYTRWSRWSKAGVLDRVFERLQHAQVVRVKIDAVSLDSTSIKVHPDGTGALKKTVRKP